MHTIQTFAKFTKLNTTRTKTPPDPTRLVHPLNIIINRLRLPHPQPEMGTKLLKVPYAKYGILREKILGGHTNYLVITVNLNTATPALDETLEILKYEPSTTTLRWLSDIRPRLYWANEERTRVFKFPLPLKALGRAWDHFGPPHTDGFWLARLLQPNRYGAAIQTVKTGHYRIWVKLERTT